MALALQATGGLAGPQAAAQVTELHRCLRARELDFVVGVAPPTRFGPGPFFKKTLEARSKEEGAIRI